MEEGSKKPILIGIIVVCVVLAGVITLKRRGGGSRIPKEWEKEQIWVKCINPECDYEGQMNKAEFYEWQENYPKEHPGVYVAPPMPCPECGKNSLKEAVKCAKCGHIFVKIYKGGDFSDRCPECGYSQTEQDRKAAARK